MTPPQDGAAYSPAVLDKPQRTAYPSIGSGPRGATIRPEFGPIVEGVDFVPRRVSREKIVAARELLERDGAVILTGWPVERDSLVNAASAMLGTRLRELEKIQERTTENTATTREDRHRSCCIAMAPTSSASSTIAWCRSASPTPTTS